jgi:hypothetical protein
MYVTMDYQFCCNRKSDDYIYTKCVKPYKKITMVIT